MYGASIPNYYYTIEAHDQTKDSGSDIDAPMKRNVCYAAAIVGDERYSYVSWGSHHGRNTEYSVVHDSPPNDDVV